MKKLYALKDAYESGKFLALKRWHDSECKNCNCNMDSFVKFNSFLEWRDPFLLKNNRNKRFSNKFIYDLECAFQAGENTMMFFWRGNNFIRPGITSAQFTDFFDFLKSYILINRK